MWAFPQSVAQFIQSTKLTRLLRGATSLDEAIIKIIIYIARHLSGPRLKNVLDERIINSEEQL